MEKETETQAAEKKADTLNEHHHHVAVIDILGQKAHIPINQYLVFMIVILVLGLVSIEYISHGVSDTIRYVTHGGYTRLSDGGGTEKHSAKIYQFWTPGEHTWADLVESCGKDKDCLTTITKWKATYVTDRKTLQNFGKALKMEMDVPGYSRFEVVGAGSSGEKSGWYWRIVILPEDEFDKQKFYTLYSKYFNRTKVGIEESEIGSQI